MNRTFNYPNGHLMTAWYVNFRIMGWLSLIGTIGLYTTLVLAHALEIRNPVIADPGRLVEMCVPLMIGFQAAFLFSPDDEPCLEIILATPRPLWLIVFDRLLVLFSTQSILACVLMGISNQFGGGESFLLAWARWLPTAILFAGIGIDLTLRTRQPAFSASVIGLLWFIGGFFGNALLPDNISPYPFSLIQPHLWLLHPYLQPHDLTGLEYAVNRMLVTAMGVVLWMVAVYWLRNQEQLMSDSSAKEDR